MIYSCILGNGEYVPDCILIILSRGRDVGLQVGVLKLLFRDCLALWSMRIF